MSEARISKEMIPSILDSIHSGIIAVDRDGKVIICNTAADTMLGVDSDVSGMNIKSFVPETKMFEVINSGQGHYGKRFCFRDKTFVANRTPIVDSFNEIIGAVAVFQDVTDLEEILKELESFKKINKELETIIETSYDGIIITDGEGNVTKINQSLLRVTDLTEEFFIGKNTDDLYGQGVFSYEAVAKRARVGKNTLTGLQKIQTGKEVMVTSTPILDDKGKVTRVVTNVRDMSDIINLQEQLAKSKELSSHLCTEFNKMLEADLRSHELISRNPIMYQLLELTRRVADSDVTVLIQGESGVGKEVFAKLVHVWSKRKGAFIKLNCSALPSHLLESELFGYTKGAFTGANVEGKPGFFERADGGTLFLDEVEDLPLELQGKFLRVLQDGEFTRLGGTKVIKVDVRLVAASNKDLPQMVENGKFRQDLYYRLLVVPILIPPLRERKEDIPLLIEFFLTKFNDKYRTNKSIAAQLVKKLVENDWPGNIRELKNVIERIVLTSSDDVISKVSFMDPKEILTQEPDDTKLLESKQEEVAWLLKPAVEKMERELLSKAIQLCNNSRLIGQMLGISHTSVLKKLRKYDLRIN